MGADTRPGGSPGGDERRGRLSPWRCSESRFSLLKHRSMLPSPFASGNCPSSVSITKPPGVLRTLNHHTSAGARAMPTRRRWSAGRIVCCRPRQRRSFRKCRTRCCRSSPDSCLRRHAARSRSDLLVRKELHRSLSRRRKCSKLGCIVHGTVRSPWRRRRTLPTRFRSRSHPVAPIALCLDQVAPNWAEATGAQLRTHAHAYVGACGHLNDSRTPISIDALAACHAHSGQNLICRVGSAES